MTQHNKVCSKGSEVGAGRGNAVKLHVFVCHPYVMY